MMKSNLISDIPHAVSYEARSFAQRLSQFQSDFELLWKTTSDQFAPFGRRYTLDEQRSMESRVDRTIRLEAEMSQPSEEESLLQMQRLKTAVRSLVVHAVDRENREKTERMLKEFSDNGDEFFHQARAFDRELSPQDIFQALRNLWIVNSMQVAFDLRVRINPSGFAYSLLYPYTDNFLDGPGSRKGKVIFNELLANRLEGVEIPTGSVLTRRVSELVEMIEIEYPRAIYPGVYESLLAIHRAQEKSLSQHAPEQDLTEARLLAVSVEKGGSSVLADAYVAKGELCPDEAEFAFGYGVFLQFIDDLQDVSEDLRNGHQTLFTSAARRGDLERKANKLARFTDTILATNEFLSDSRMHAMAELVNRSCTWLILESIALNQQLYCHRYLEDVEVFSPLRFDYVRRLHSEMRSKQKKLRPMFQRIPVH